MEKTNNAILIYFKNTPCKNKLFKKWDKDLKNKIEKLFKENSYEQQSENEIHNKRNGEKRTIITITKFE